MFNTKSLQAYETVGTECGVMNADPHRLVQMLMEAALDRIGKARGHLQRGEVGPRGENISTALMILGGLEASLDPVNGKEIAENLSGLYKYMIKRLLEANMNGEMAALEEVASLLGEVKAGWDGIADFAREQMQEAVAHQADEEGKTKGVNITG